MDADIRPVWGRLDPVRGGGLVPAVFGRVLV
jgi:hypothetical protein